MAAASPVGGKVLGNSSLFQGIWGKVFIFHQKSFQVFPAAVWGHSLVLRSPSLCTHMSRS